MFDNKQDYTYADSGFDDFLTRGFQGATQTSQSPPQQNRELNFDQSAVTGSLGDKLKVGRIQLDGTTGRISTFDENGNEIVRIGDLG